MASTELTASEGGLLTDSNREAVSVTAFQVVELAVMICRCVVADISFRKRDVRMDSCGHILASRSSIWSLRLSMRL